MNYRQLGIPLLLKDNYATEDYSYLLFYYPNRVLATGEVVFDTHLKKIAVDPTEGEKVFQKAITVLHSDEPPRPSSECKYCSWAKGISES